MLDEQAIYDRKEALTKQIGEELHAWMDSRQLSVKAVADRLGYDRTTVAHAVSGRDIPAEDFFLRCQQAYGGAENLIVLRQELERIRKEQRQATRAARRGETPPRSSDGTGAIPLTFGAPVHQFRPQTQEFIAWIAEHSGESFEQVYSGVAARMDLIRAQHPAVRHGQAHVRGQATRQQIAEALTSYYGQGEPTGPIGFCRARVGTSELALSVLSEPGWLEATIRLDTAHELFRLEYVPQAMPVMLDGSALNAAMHKLAEVEAAGTVLYNNPLYRLLDVAISGDSLGATLAVDDFAGYALTMDLLEAELIDSLGMTDIKALPLRACYLPTITSALEFRKRMCAGGPLALFAAARPPTGYGDGGDFVLLVQERSARVLNVTGKLAVVPKAFHGPTVEPTEEVRLSASLERELEEELLGRAELEDLPDTPSRKVDPFHPTELSEPMRWLAERRGTDSYRLECTGFGINMVNGNYEFPCLIVIDDEEWWARYGGHVEANWEIRKIRRYSSQDTAGLQTLISDPKWSNEGLFALLRGLLRLDEIDTMSRLALPEIQVEV